MNKYLFIFKNQNILVSANNKLEAIEILNEQYKTILENDFQVITVGVEIDELKRIKQWYNV